MIFETPKTLNNGDYYCYRMYNKKLGMEVSHTNRAMKRYFKIRKHKQEIFIEKS